MAPAPDDNTESAAPPRRRFPVLLVVPVVLALGGGALWYFLADSGPQPSDLFRTALTKLDEGDNVTAYELCKQLEALNYRDPDFSGGTQFILGVVAFRAAETLDEDSRLRRYETTIELLREAAHLAIADSHKPEWNYVLGTALHQRGNFNEARPLLEGAVHDYPPGRVAATEMLLETYLHGRNPVDLEAGLRLSNAVVQLPDLGEEDRNRAVLQQAQLLFELDRKQAAEEVLQKISGDNARTLSLNVLRAQTYLSEGKLQEAYAILEPAARTPTLEESYARQAWLLLGICTERLGDEAALNKKTAEADRQYQAALTAYTETAHKYEREHEALAAWLQAGDLYRRLKRSEEAIEAYREALGMVHDVQQFRNRWLDLSDFRARIASAWEDWSHQPRLDADLFQKSLKLCDLMPPLFAPYEAAQYRALANQEWAQRLETAGQQKIYADRHAGLAEIRQRWKLSGLAFAEAARLNPTNPEYATLIWSGAENLMHGHAYPQALEQYDKYLESGTTQQIAVSWVQKGKAYLNQGQIDKALEQFLYVVTKHPTDPIVYEARYLSGHCYVEKQNYPEAEKVWRGLIASSDLSPKAQEWMLSLHALANLVGTQADILRGQAALQMEATDPAPRLRLESQAFDRWEETIVLWEQFLERYPDAEQALQARYQLGRARHMSAEWLLQQQELADNENARQNFAEQRQQRLQGSLADYQFAFERLLKIEEDKLLDPLTDTLLRNTQFQIAHNHFLLGNYRQAIDAYSAAANRYQQHPAAILACVQMVECYERQQQLTEARSMLELARRTLDKLPDSAFDPAQSNFTRAEWQTWIGQIARLQPGLIRQAASTAMTP